MPARADVVFFAGPTLGAGEREAIRARRLRLKPPAKRLDIEKLVSRAKHPGVIVLVDGVFHEALAVGHAELRAALAAGWRVFGLGSMGAIRAREMGPFGMEGYGDVFQRFCDEGDFQDDEVALLHEAELPYRALTEPLIHLREALDHLVDAAVLSAEEAHAVVTALKSLWYGDRTVEGTIRLLVQHGAGGARVRRELQDFDRFRVKTRDLRRFLEDALWETPPDSRRSNATPYLFQPTIE